MSTCSNRQTDRQTDRQTRCYLFNARFLRVEERFWFPRARTGRQACRHAGRHAGRQGFTCSIPGFSGWKSGLVSTCSDRQTGRQAGRVLPVQYPVSPGGKAVWFPRVRTDRQTDRQTNRQTGRYLFNARFLRVEERSGFHVLWDQGTAHFGDFVPVVEGRQGQMLVRHLLHTCGGQRWGAMTRWMVAAPPPTTLDLFPIKPASLRTTQD